MLGIISLVFWSQRYYPQKIYSLKTCTKVLLISAVYSQRIKNSIGLNQWLSNRGNFASKSRDIFDHHNWGMEVGVVCSGI